MGLLTERYFGYDIPGWAYAEDLDDYFMTIDEGRAAPLVLAMTNDPELTRFGPETCEIATQTEETEGCSWAAQGREERAERRVSGRADVLVPGTTRSNLGSDPSPLIWLNLGPN